MLYEVTVSTYSVDQFAKEMAIGRVDGLNEKNELLNLQ